jgi:hypothetical protein
VAAMLGTAATPPHPTAFAALQQSTSPRTRGEVKAKQSRSRGAVFAPELCQTARKGPPKQTKGEAERRKAQDRYRGPANKRCRLSLRPIAARAAFGRRSPSGALPRLSPEASRPKAQSGPALLGSGQPIRPPAASSWQTGDVAGRAGFGG